MKTVINEIKRMQHLAGIINENDNSLLNTLYNKVIFYMDNNYNNNEISHDDVYTIVNDVIIPRNPNLIPGNKLSNNDFRQLINKISDESEYTFIENI